MFRSSFLACDMTLRVSQNDVPPQKPRKVVDLNCKPHAHRCYIIMLIQKVSKMPKLLPSIYHLNLYTRKKVYSIRISSVSTKTPKFTGEEPHPE